MSSSGSTERSNGFRFGYFTLGPASVTLPEDLDFDAALAELADKLPGLTDVAELQQRLVAQASSL